MTFFYSDNLRAVTGGRWLRRIPEATRLHGVGIDSREDLQGKIFLAIKGQNFDGHDFVGAAAAAGAGLVIVEAPPAADAVPDDVGILQVADTRQALGRLARAYRRTLKLTKVVAVTGTAGKTTTKQLVHAVLSTAMRGSVAPESYNNDIGVPLTILQAQSSDQYLVVEIGTNAPGEVAGLARIAEPDIGIITMIGHGHLEGLGSVEAVAREKMSLLMNLRESGLAIVNADSPLLRPAVRLAQTTVLFGESDEADLRLTGRGERDGVWWFEVNHRQKYKLSMPGRHNAINALAAVAVARRFGIHDSMVSDGLARAEVPGMRLCQGVAGSVRIINDAYNANPDSMVAALDTFLELESRAPRRVLVLGDMLELGSAGPRLHRELAEYIKEADRRASIDEVLLIGDLVKHTAKELEKTWDADRVTLKPEIKRSTKAVLDSIVQPGDAVLIKGSRSIGLEQIVSWLERRRSRRPTGVRVRTSRAASSRQTKASGLSRRR